MLKRIYEVIETPNMVENHSAKYNLYNMATGVTSADKLFVNGQMKVEGNISKGAELRYLIGKTEE